MPLYSGAAAGAPGSGGEKGKKERTPERADDGNSANRQLAAAAGKEIRRHLEVGNVDTVGLTKNEK